VELPTDRMYYRFDVVGLEVRTEVVCLDEQNEVRCVEQEQDWSEDRPLGNSDRTSVGTDFNG